MDDVQKHNDSKYITVSHSATQQQIELLICIHNTCITIDRENRILRFLSEWFCQVVLLLD
jgi:hypothetical protein